MNTKAAIMSALSVLVLVGCGYDARDVRNLLASVGTSAEEREAFDTIWKKTRVRFAAFDTAGAQLSYSVTGWQNRVDYIVFYFDGGTVKHKLIAPDNLFMLTRE